MQTFLARAAHGVLACALACSAGLAVAAAPPDFTVVSPQPGATLSSPVTLRVALANTELGKPTAGLDHLHYSIDGGPEVALYRNKDIVLDLTPGMHVITIELAGPTHRARMAARKIPFMVRE